MPSGVSYVIENRRAMTQSFPELFAEPPRATRSHDYPARLLAALRAAAPPGVDDPTVVVLTPGVYNAAYFEHALLARLMGVELVEGRDLVCRGNACACGRRDGERPVDVVYRRVDDEFLDPLHFRADSMLGLPRAPQRGPRRQRHDRQRGRQRRRRRQAALHLRARPDPLLPGRGADARQRRDVPPRRPGRARTRCSTASTSSCSSRSTARAARASSSGRRPATRRSPSCTTVVANDPRGWIAQRPVALSTAPTLIGDRLAPAARRPAAVRGQRRRRRLGAARRAHPGRAARGRARRQLQPGRRLEGHLGAGRRGAAGAGAARRRSARPRRRAASDAPASRRAAMRGPTVQMRSRAATAGGRRC